MLTAEKSTRMVNSSATHLPHRIWSLLRTAISRAKTWGEPRKPSPIANMPAARQTLIQVNPPLPQILTRPGSIICRPA